MSTRAKGGNARGPAGGRPGPALTRVRAGRPTDAAALAQLGALTFRESYGEHTPAEDLEAYIAENYNAPAQAAELSAPDRAVFVAERGGVPIGFAMLGEGEPAPAGVPGQARAIQLERIYVLQAAQRTGAGTALLRACLREARRRGARTLWLTAWSENHKALSFYRHHGFRRVGTHPFRLGSLVFLDPVLARSVGAPNG